MPFLLRERIDRDGVHVGVDALAADLLLEVLHDPLALAAQSQRDRGRDHLGLLAGVGGDGLRRDRGQRRHLRRGALPVLDDVGLRPDLVVEPGAVLAWRRWSRSSATRRRRACGRRSRPKREPTSEFVASAPARSWAALRWPPPPPPARRVATSRRYRCPAPGRIDVSPIGARGREIGGTNRDRRLTDPVVVVHAPEVGPDLLRRRTARADSQPGEHQPGQQDHECQRAADRSTSSHGGSPMKLGGNTGSQGGRSG